MASLSAACSRTATTSARVAALRPRPTLLAATAPRPSPSAPTTHLGRAPRAAAAARSVAARAAAVEAPVLLEADSEQPISLTPAAMAQLERLRREEAKEGQATSGLLLRMGVRSGGCSGMSYDMKFEQEANIDPEDDTVLEFATGGQAAAASGGASGGGATAAAPPLRVAVDGKSLLFLFGMQVDFSDALVGGGFKFVNPQATDTCGCGKSFSA